MNVIYPDVSLAEKMVVVKYGSKSAITSLFSNVSIILYKKYMTRKTQNQMKGIGRSLELKRRTEKQQIECKLSSYKF